MITGIGVDIVQIPRIEKLLQVKEEALLERILDESEANYFKALASHKKAAFLAKRFAAKEAISKAIGTGIRGELSFKKIIISNDINGKPLALIDLPKYKDLAIHLSLSDDYPSAIAYCIIEEKKGGG